MQGRIAWLYKHVEEKSLNLVVDKEAERVRRLMRSSITFKCTYFFQSSPTS
jgi:hypothetical protein